MKKQIRQITGTSIGITFTKEEKEIYGIKLGDWIDLSDAIIISDQLKKIKQNEPRRVNKK